MYAKITNGVVEKFPYSIGNLRKDNPQVSFPKNPTDALLAIWGVVPVVDVATPAYNSFTQTIDEVLPVFANGRWERSYVVRNKTAEELAAAAKALQEDISNAAQQRLDDFAQTRGYDDIKSASSYAGCSVPKFDVEGTYCRDARALTWDALYRILGEVQAGTRPVPTGFADIESELPPLVWPTQS